MSQELLHAALVNLSAAIRLERKKPYHDLRQHPRYEEWRDTGRSMLLTDWLVLKCLEEADVVLQAQEVIVVPPQPVPNEHVWNDPLPDGDDVTVGEGRRVK